MNGYIDNSYLFPYCITYYTILHDIVGEICLLRCVLCISFAGSYVGHDLCETIDKVNVLEYRIRAKQYINLNEAVWIVLS